MSFSFNLMLVAGGIFFGSFAFAEDCQSPLVGEWVLKPSSQRIIVKENLATFHSRWGDGDIKHLNADRFMLTWYSPKSGKPFRACQAVFTLTIKGEYAVWNPSKSKDCELGTMSRRSDSGGWIPSCKIKDHKKSSILKPESDPLPEETPDDSGTSAL
jgi:hypothetical protein